MKRKIDLDEIEIEDLTDEEIKQLEKSGLIVRDREGKLVLVKDLKLKCR